MLAVTPNKLIVGFAGVNFGAISSFVLTTSPLYGPVAALIDFGATPQYNEVGEPIPVSLDGYQFEFQGQDFDLCQVIQAVCLTHGHLDHVLGVANNGVAQIARAGNRQVPVVGTPFTIAVAAHLAKEGYGRGRFLSFQHPSATNGTNLTPLGDWLSELSARAPGNKKVIFLDPFEVEFTASQHNTIPAAAHIFVNSPAGKACFALDFNWHDEDWLKGFADKLVEDKINIVVCDSTGALYEHEEPTDEAIQANFEKIFSQAPGITVVSTFSTNIPRWQQVLDAAVKTGKKYIAVLGRTAREMIQIAQAMGYISFERLRLIDDVALIGSFIGDEYIDPAKTIVLSTGCQAEPGAGLTRFIYGDERNPLGIYDNVTIAISASTIPVPSNQDNVKNMLAEFVHACLLGKFTGQTKLISGDLKLERILRQITEDKKQELHKEYGYVPKDKLDTFVKTLNALIEYQSVSRHGHASAARLLVWFELIHQKYQRAKLPLPCLVLTHGTRQHQNAALELARQAGWPENRLFAPTEGQVLVWEDGNAQLTSMVAKEIWQPEKGTLPENPIVRFRGNLELNIPFYTNDQGELVLDGDPAITPKYIGQPRFQIAGHLLEQLRDALILRLKQEYNLVLPKQSESAVLQRLIDLTINILFQNLPVVREGGTYYQNVPFVDTNLIAHN